MRRDYLESTQSYILEVDIVEYRSYFSFAVWNGAVRLQAGLLSTNNNIIGTGEGVGISKSMNTMGNATAKKVAQDAYNGAIADLLSNLKALELK